MRVQSRAGHIPNYVDVKTGEAEYAGTGNMGAVDGVMWVVLAAYKYYRMQKDQDFLSRYFEKLALCMRWLEAHDTNNCGLIEVPEASDWADLFPRSYNVLYDEVLWYQTNRCFSDLIDRYGSSGEPRSIYDERAEHVRDVILKQFWPTPEYIRHSTESFAETQYSLGRTHYLISQITPFGFNWRCDVYANILAYIYNILDYPRARSVYTFLRGIAIDTPHPVRVLYPSIRPGDPDWRDYFLVNLLNLPNHYHNGGIRPFVGGLWVHFLLKLGKREHAQQALSSLAAFCEKGIERPWEFNEWGNGETGRPMGKAFQAWSAAAYISAYLYYQGDERADFTWGQENFVEPRAEFPQQTPAGSGDELPAHGPASETLGTGERGGKRGGGT